jgi:Tfp pilus assembly protein PilO
MRSLKMFKIAGKKTTQTVISCLIYGLVLVLLYIFVGRSVSRYSERLKSDLLSQSQKIKEDESLIRAYPNPEKEIENIEKRIQELKTKAASREQIPRIIQQLARKSSELNLNIISIKPLEDIKFSEERLIEGVSKVYIEIVMLSSYRVTGDYLKALTELPIILTVENLSIEEKQGAFLSPTPSEGNELLVTLLLSAYMVLEI